MRNYLFLLVVVIIYILQGCKDVKEQKAPLLMTLLNEELIAYSYDIKRDTLNVLEYEIMNQSEDIYYINNLFEQKKFFIPSIYKNGINIRIFDDKNKEVKYDESIFSFGFRDSDSQNDSIWLYKSAILKNLEVQRNKDEDHFWYYSTINSKHSFFIHPQEKIFFKMYLNLTDTIAYEDARLNYAKIYNDKKYNARLELVSDSSNYKKVLPNQILKRIKQNKVKVYHGIIQSKNNIPVKVLGNVQD